MACGASERDARGDRAGEHQPHGVISCLQMPERRAAADADRNAAPAHASRRAASAVSSARDEDVELVEDVADVDLDCRGRDEHALADLRVGEARGDVADDLELGRGDALPAAGWALARAARASDPGDRLVGAEFCALSPRGLEGLLAHPLAQRCLECRPVVVLGRQRTVPRSARARPAAASRRTASSWLSSPAATSASASSRSARSRRWPPSTQTSRCACTCCLRCRPLPAGGRHAGQRQPPRGGEQAIPQSFAGFDWRAGRPPAAAASPSSRRHTSANRTSAQPPV